MCSCPRKNGSNLCFSTSSGLSISPLKPLMDMPQKIGMYSETWSRRPLGACSRPKSVHVLLLGYEWCHIGITQSVRLKHCIKVRSGCKYSSFSCTHPTLTHCCCFRRFLTQLNKHLPHRGWIWHLNVMPNKSMHENHTYWKCVTPNESAKVMPTWSVHHCWAYRKLNLLVESRAYRKHASLLSLLKVQLVIILKPSLRSWMRRIMWIGVTWWRRC